MSARREHRIRKLAYRKFCWNFEFIYDEWRLNEPPKWRIFTHLKWKKEFPIKKLYDYNR